MAPALTISSAAYYKLFFHAAKHPHQPVNGVLLGKQTGNKIEVEDAVPLLHHWTNLSPIMEVALDMAGQHADDVGLKIVAYYQAQRNVADVSLGSVAETILQRLREKFKDVLGLVIDGEDFGTGKAALVPWIWSGDAWRLAPDSDKAFTPGSSYQLASTDLPVSAGNYVKEGLHHALGDFDDHLEDVAIDWRENKACIPVDG